jgi:hypothetical protein
MNPIAKNISPRVHFFSQYIKKPSASSTKDRWEVLYKYDSHHKLLTLLLFSIFFQNLSFSQNLWEDKAMVDSLKSGINDVYNFEFGKAESIRDIMNTKYPNHPSGLMYEALILNWKYYPLQSGSDVGNKFESLLLKSLEASELQLEKLPDHQLTRFFAMMPRMMLLQFYAENGLGMKSAPHLSAAYKSIEKGFELCQATPEFYFTTGLYNYYIEAYPKANPFYKPIVYFFPRGNKEDGLKDLYKCWLKSDFIGQEALSFLSYIYINYESNYTDGLKFTSELTNTYPNNPLFAQLNLQMLLQNKQYRQAEIALNKFNIDETLSPYFQKTFSLYDNIIKEHFQTNLDQSEKEYKTTISSMSPYGNFSKRYVAYAYFGLSRIKKIKGLLKESQSYRLKATKTAQYPNVNFD